MLFMYILGAQIDYSPVNWERCCVIEGWLQAYSSSESPVTEETQLQSIWFNGGWQRARRLGDTGGTSGGGWLTLHAKVGGWGWQIGTKIKGDWANESSPGRWPAASLSRRKAATEAEETLSPLGAPPGAATRCHRKVILLSPLPSQLTDCHSQISSSVLPVSVSLHQLSLFQWCFKKTLIRLSFFLSGVKQHYCTLF